MNKKVVIFLLILTSCLTIASTDLYSPSLASLPEFFGTSASMVKLTMSLNLLAYALATLIHGPLSERYGRRPVLLIGVVSFCIFSFLCALAQSIDQLIIARVFQGIAAAVEGVVVLSIIRDLFEEKEQVRVIAFYGIATSITPAVAPVIGGYIHVIFGWQMNFYLLSFLGFVVTVCIGFFLRETGVKDPSALSVRGIFTEYVQILSNTEFIKYTSVGAGNFGAIFAFVTAGPFILINNHGLSTVYFGYFYMFIISGYVGGNLLVANRLIKILEIKTILQIGFIGLITGATFLLFITFNNNETVLTLAIAMFIIGSSVGPVFATVPTLAMKSSSSRTGPTAAMLLTLQLLGGVIAAFSVGFFHDGTSRPMGVTIAVMLLFSILIYFAMPNKKGTREISAS